MENVLLRLENISVSFDDDLILDNISLEIKDKEFVTLLGPSGCGKTTTLRIIGGFFYPPIRNVNFYSGRMKEMSPSQRPINNTFSD